MDLGSLLTAAILQSWCKMGGSAIRSKFKVMGLLDTCKTFKILIA